MSANVIQLVYFMEYLNCLNSQSYHSNKETQLMLIKLKEKSMSLVKQITKILLGSNLVSSGKKLNK